MCRGLRGISGVTVDFGLAVDHGVSGSAVTVVVILLVENIIYRETYMQALATPQFLEGISKVQVGHKIGIESGFLGAGIVHILLANIVACKLSLEARNPEIECIVEDEIRRKRL